MTIRRAIATECGTTCLTSPQVDPVRADLYALIAFTMFGMLDALDHLEVRTSFRRHNHLFLSELK